MKNTLTKAELVAFIEELCEELECDWRQLGCIANPDVLYGKTEADRPEREAFYVGARAKAMQVAHKIRTTIAGKPENWHPMSSPCCKGKDQVPFPRRRINWPKDRTRP